MEMWLVGNETTQASFVRFWESDRDRLVRAVATTIGDADAAADAVDEAMARAWDRWPRVGTLEAPAGWVYRVAVNHARTRWRRRRREVPGDPGTPVVDRRAGVTTDPLDDRLQRAVLALDDDRRAVVVTRLVLDLSTRQTAETLDIPEGTVRSRLSRAVADLRATMEVT